MHPLNEQHREAIRELCRDYGITRLELFGSAATDAFDPDSSDVDFIVDYPPDDDFGPWCRAISSSRTGSRRCCAARSTW